MKFQDEIVDYALRWEGTEEIPNNMGWESELFEQLMDQVGWHRGFAWCSFFVKMVYYHVYKDTEWGEQVMRLFDGSATKTFDACQDSPRFFTSIRDPVRGAIAVWRWWDNGSRDWRGHEGIVIDPGMGRIGDLFGTIEGNINDDGSPGKITRKNRTNNHGEKDGLVTEGFIFPPPLLYKKSLISV